MQRHDDDITTLSACFYWVSDAIEGEKRVEFGSVNSPRTCEQDVLDLHLKPSNGSTAGSPLQAQ